MKKRTLGTVFVMMLLLAGDLVYATTWYVAPDGTGDALSIAGGIDLSAAGDTVLVACGTYFESGISMTVPITLVSETGDPDCVTIDAQSIETIIYCGWLDDTAIVNGFTLIGGHGNMCGGIEMTESAAIQFERCVFSDNNGGVNPGGGRGGAVGCFEQSYALFRHCRLENNIAYGGGGVFCADQAEVSLDSCVLVNNSAFWGGGVQLDDDSVGTITNCTFYRNLSGVCGAGVTNWSSSTPWITNTIIAFSIDSSAIDGYCELSACDLYGNALGDWVGAIADQLGMGCNMSVDPLFCDIVAGDFGLHADSACLPGNNDCGVQIGAYGLGCGAVSASADQVPPGRLTVHCYPNPFNPQTTVSFTLDTQRAEIAVYDLTGKLLGVLADRTYAAGDHSVVWNGKDASGRAVPSGTYIVRLETDSRVEARKVMLVR